MHRIISLLLLSFVFSCSSEKPAEVGGQQTQGTENNSFAVEITPVNATRNSTIYLVPHGVDVAHAKVEWLINGVHVTSSATDRFSSETMRKGDKVQARIDIEGRSILSNTVEIQNSLPVLSKVKVLPEIFKPGDVLSVEALGDDADGDEVILSYEWTKNGEPAGNDSRIGGPLQRGDKIDVKITPYDGAAYGQPVILHKEIVNLPPMINQNDAFDFTGDIYTYQVRASDPDGDSLTYSLNNAPAGMTVYPATGFVRWSVPRSFKGRASFIVSVTDGHGGTASQELYVDINPAQ